MKHLVTRTTSAVLALAVLSGCAVNMPVPVNDPVPTTLAYQAGAASKPVTLGFKDEQNDVDKKALLTGTIPMNMLSKGQPLNGVNWIAEHTVKEMVARGLPVVLAGQGGDATNVVVRRVHIENYRASGFSPFITFSSIRADVDTPQGPQRVTAYVKRAKVPVWTFNEIIDPTFNDSLSVLTKELAAKLNQQLFKQSISDAQVAELVAKIGKDADSRADAWLDVYQLGFGNNQSAVPELVKLATSASEYVRLAAVSSLGILKAESQMKFLVERHESRSLIWQDRAMALKAIGDLNTAESRRYLEAQLARYKDDGSKESMWTRDIIGLYL